MATVTFRSENKEAAVDAALRARSAQYRRGKAPKMKRTGSSRVYSGAAPKTLGMCVCCVDVFSKRVHKFQWRIRLLVNIHTKKTTIFCASKLCF
jgi:hypothetical protein